MKRSLHFGRDDFHSIEKAFVSKEKQMKKYFSILLLTLATGSSFAQFTNILISNLNYPEEVSICFNPKNTNQVVAGANIDNDFNSNDGGLTWNVGTIVEPTTGVWGDPAIFTDTT